MSYINAGAAAKTNHNNTVCFEVFFGTVRCRSVSATSFHAGAREVLGTALGTKIMENVIKLYALQTNVTTGNLYNSSHRFLTFFLEKSREFSAASLADN